MLLGMLFSDALDLKRVKITGRKDGRRLKNSLRFLTLIEVKCLIHARRDQYLV